MSRTGGIAYLQIGSGARRNALGIAGWQDIARTATALSDDDGLQILVLRGGGGTFCAGSDMREWLTADPVVVDESFEAMELAFSALEEMPVPVVAVVDGVAAGAGCQLALACDLQLLAASSKIGMPIARLGILPSVAFASRLVGLAGSSVARDLLYTGRLLGAEEALVVGLATRVVADAQLDAAAAELVADVCRQPAAAVRAAKAAVRQVQQPMRDHARQWGNGPPVEMEDFRRGIQSFLSSPAAGRPGATPGRHPRGAQ